MTMISTVAVNLFLSVSRNRKLTTWNSVLRYSTLCVSLVFQCILKEYSHHRFITLEDRLVVGLITVYSA